MLGRPTRSLKRVGRVATSALALALAILVTIPVPALAEPVPGERCDYGKRESYVLSAQVTPVVTHYLGYYVTSGTSGSRTDSLSVTNTVTTTYGTNTEISSTAGEALAQVGTKVGFSVQTTTSTTRTESTSMQWSFSQPGYYGLYKGTRRVDGTVKVYICNWLGLRWMPPLTLDYTTYSYMEEGTVTCNDVLPPDTVRGAARQQLHC
ncbi:hypothetical protein ACFYOT_37985 [Saccharothrix saharensis]|uniref:hypothetical protein n=1 Tax=Saccharothrix saharensis TaxID=571190 RepID=UPI0036A9BB00